MKEEVQRNIRRLVSHSPKQFIVFIKENEEIADEIITFQEIDNVYKLSFN